MCHSCLKHLKNAIQASKRDRELPAFPYISFPEAPQKRDYTTEKRDWHELGNTCPPPLMCKDYAGCMWYLLPNACAKHIHKQIRVMLKLHAIVSGFEDTLVLDTRDCINFCARGSAERIWGEFFILAWRILGKFPANFSANYDGKFILRIFRPCFSRVSGPHKKFTPKIHVQNCRHSSPISLS